MPRVKPERIISCKEDREFLNPGESSSIRSQRSWRNDFCKWRLMTTPGHVIRFKFAEMKIDCREEVNGFFFGGDSSKLEGAYHKAPICGTDREYVDIYSDEQDVELIFKYKSNEAALFDVRFESVAASEARGQLRVSDIDSAVMLYTRRESRPPPVRLNSAQNKQTQSPVPLAELSYIRPNSSPNGVPATTLSTVSATALLSQPWMLLTSATLAVLLLTCISCFLFYWRKEKKRDRTTSESPVIAPPVLKNMNKRRPPPAHSGINDQKVHRFKS